MSKIVTVFPSIQSRILVDCVVGIPDNVNPIHSSSSVICHALIDTGAMISAISNRIVSYMNLPVSGSQEIIAANNHHDVVDSYIVNLGLNSEVYFPLVQVSCLDMDEYDIIIGMDLLNQGDLIISNVDGRTVFIFEQHG